MTMNLPQGCRHHPVCATCPFPDCIAGYKTVPYSMRPLEVLPAAPTMQEAEAEAQRQGVVLRTVYRRLARQRAAG